MPTKAPQTPRRHHILALLASVLGLLFLWELSSPFPRAATRISTAVIFAAIATYLLWRIIHSRRIGLRTLVVIAPAAVAIICFPLTYVLENRRLLAGLEGAGVVSFQIEPNGKLAETIGDVFRLLFDYQVANHFKTKLRTIHLDLSDVQEDALASIPSKHLESVWVSTHAKGTLTKSDIVWLNDLPDTCDLTISLIGLTDENLRLVDYLEHDVNSLFMSEYELSEKALHSVLNLTPNNLFFRDIGLVTNDSLAEAPIVNVEVLRLGRNTFSNTDIVDLLKTTNPKTLVLLNDMQQVAPRVFESIFALKRLEGLSTRVPWLTRQHLESLRLSETLRWASFQRSGVREKDFSRLRTASPTVRINGKLGPAE